MLLVGSGLAKSHRFVCVLIDGTQSIGYSNRDKEGFFEYTVPIYALMASAGIRKVFFRNQKAHLV
jgi:hypothetical protein